MWIDRITVVESPWNGNGSNRADSLERVLSPHRTGRMVLDSAVDQEWLWNDVLWQQTDGYKERFDDLMDWVAAHDHTNGLGDSSLKVYQRWADRHVQGPSRRFCSYTDRRVVGERGRFLQVKGLGLGTVGRLSGADARAGVADDECKTAADGIG
ncbi:hypothetical protein P3H15_41855 [Rhodococcus sp. T2V]|nr:hypothetical protein [Rhodococcus sp. T2V]